MHILAVANQKGGCAKTTTAVMLAHGLALAGKTVWLVDMDPQGQVALSLGLDQASGVYDLLAEDAPVEAVLQETGRPRLFVVPGDGRTLRCQILMIGEGWGLDVLSRALQSASGDLLPDCVIVDTPPSPGGLQTVSIWAADWVIIPCACDYLSTDGVAKALAAMDDLAGRGWRGRLLRVLPTLYDDVTRESRAVLADLQKTLGAGRVWDPVHRATVLRECAAVGKTIWEQDPRSRAAREYIPVVETVLREVCGE